MGNEDHETPGYIAMEASRAQRELEERYRREEAVADAREALAVALERLAELDQDRFTFYTLADLAHLED